jgi:hypothetical protein
VNAGKLERSLAHLAELARAAGQRLGRIEQDLGAVRAVMDDTDCDEAELAAGRAADGTSRDQGAQVEARSK